jgi:mono/diheme cytochrome c family protein
VVVGALALSAALAGCGGGTRLPYTEHFSGSCDRWPAQDDARLKAGCGDGEYQVLVGKARNVQFFTIPVKADGIRVEVDVRVAAGPAPRKYGIGCFFGDRSGYWAVLTPREGYEIVSYLEEPERNMARAYSLSAERHAISGRKTYRLRADCGRPNVVMWVDGRSVLTAPEVAALLPEVVQRKPAPFRHVGVVVFPSSSGSDVRFDDFSAESLPPAGTANERPLASFARVPKWAKQEGFSNNMEAVDGALEFVQSGCLSCHTYLGAGSSNLGAPDLSAEGRKHRGLSWQVTHLRCPACRAARSTMPSFAVLGVTHLHELAVFLEASKD